MTSSLSNDPHAASVSQNAQPDSSFISIEQISIPTNRVNTGIISTCPQLQHGLNDSCDDSDGRFCMCQFRRPERLSFPCIFRGRSVSPLAFSICHNSTDCSICTNPRYSSICPYSIDPQPDAPLCSLPAELRNQIYTYVLTDHTTNPLKRDNALRTQRRYGVDRKLLPYGASLALLQTCKQIYLETYKLPFLLNGFVHVADKLLNHQQDGLRRPVLKNLQPWQFALIQKLDLSLTQDEMRTDCRGLEDFLRRWRAKDRHEGTFIAPRYYQPIFVQDKPCPYLEEGYDTFGFGYVTDVPKEELKDGTLVTLRSQDPSAVGGLASPAPAMVARPLTHLTLRLSRVDWVGWFRPPQIASQTRELRLSGPVGFPFEDTRSAAERMYPARAGERWAKAICTFPDLEVLCFVLEVFGHKKDQLDYLVQREATEWRFELEGTEEELVWDGKVEDASYGSDILGIEPGYASHYNDKAKTIHSARYGHARVNGSEWMCDDVDVEVRIIRFVRRPKVSEVD